MRWHPRAKLFPDPSVETQETLKASLVAHGLLDKILCVRNADDELLVLDGKARVVLMGLLNMPVPAHMIEELDPNTPDEEIRDRVLARNAARSHLTTAQRAIIGARLTQPDPENPNLRLLTVSEAARALSVSETMVRHAIEVLVHVADYQITMAAERGDLALDVVAEASRLHVLPEVLRHRTPEGRRRALRDAQLVAEPRPVGRPRQDRPRPRFLRADQLPTVFDYAPSTACEFPEVVKRLHNLNNRLTLMTPAQRCRFFHGTRSHRARFDELMAGVANMQPQSYDPLRFRGHSSAAIGTDVPAHEMSLDEFARMDAEPAETELPADTDPGSHADAVEPERPAVAAA